MLSVSCKSKLLCWTLHTVVETPLHVWEHEFVRFLCSELMVGCTKAFGPVSASGQPFTATLEAQRPHSVNLNEVALAHTPVCLNLTPGRLKGWLYWIYPLAKNHLWLLCLKPHCFSSSKDVPCPFGGKSDTIGRLGVCRGLDFCARIWAVKAMKVSLEGGWGGCKGRWKKAYQLHFGKDTYLGYNP